MTSRRFKFSTLDRLAHVGFTELGALVYEPDTNEELKQQPINLDILAGQTQAVLEGETEDILQELTAKEAGLEISQTHLFQAPLVLDISQQSVLTEKEARDYTFTQQAAYHMLISEPLLWIMRIYWH